MRSALLLEYSGAAYSGSQSQPNGNAIQDKLIAALRGLGLDPKSVTLAGRTDAGVNARGQVMTFDLHGDGDPFKEIGDFKLALNALLPADIRLKEARINMPQSFHPRRDALHKWYRYQILSHPHKSPLSPSGSAWTHLKLDAERMAASACLLEGVHNFKSFKNNNSQVINDICHVQYARVHKKALPEGDLLILDIVSDRFLYKMVRNLMGQLLTVGSNALPPEAILQVMARHDRRACATAARPEGLSLMAIHYPPELNLFPEDPYIKLLNEFTLNQKDNLQHEQDLFRKAS